MNNLKRVLSLLLAVVMIVGVMAIASAAELTDAAEIEHKEAVNTMVALNIIAGKPNGDGTNKFDPDATVTRAEVAKMIFVALNGGRDNPNLTKLATPSYTDIKGNWAEGYIEYVSALKIIAGKGDGTFNPSGEVTAQELSKMLLVAIGYDPEVEGLQGTADWGINADSLAFAAGFYDNVSLASTSAALSRENAAQIIYDAINACTVGYDYKITSENGTVVTKAIREEKKTAGGADITLIGTKYGMSTDTPDPANNIYNVLRSVTLQTSGVNKGTYTINVDGVEYTKVTEDYTDLLGQQVKVLYKGNDTSAVFGVYATDANSVKEVNFSALSKAANGSGSKVTANITDGTYTAATINADDSSFNTAKLIDNTGNGEYNMAVVTTYTPAQVSYVSSTEIIAGENTFKYASATIADGIAKNDYVVSHKDLSTGKTVVEKIEAVTGTVTGYKAARAEDWPTVKQYQVGGTWYVEGSNLNLANAGADVTLYVVNGTVAFGKNNAGTTLGDLAMLLFTETANLNNSAKILLPDGTTSTVAVAGFYDNASPAAAVTAVPGQLYTYTVSETDGKYTFKQVKDSDGAVGATGYNYVATANDAKLLQSDLTTADTTHAVNKIGTVSTAASDFDISDDAVIFVYDGVGNAAAKGKVITGKQLKTLFVATAANGLDATAASFLTTKVGGLTRVAYAAVKSGDTINHTLPGVTDTQSSYGIVASNAYADTASTITYQLWTGTETVTVQEKGGDATTRTVGTVLKWSSIADGVIKDPAAVAVSAQAVEGLVGKEISFDGNKTYKLTSDTIYLYFDSSEEGEDMGKAEGTLVLADEPVTGTFIQNVLVKTNTLDTEVELVVVDVKNRLSADVGATTYAVNVGDGGTGITVPAASTAVAGETVTITLKNETGDSKNVTVTLTNGATWVDGTNSPKAGVAIAAGKSVSYQVVITGAANIDLS